ncbi:histone chaperone [Entomophthora muscae]|uniref:Histone chaperone n=1 Tax=Entomophthora muscae TaxID=34485 RepID=A0ACC2UQU3_9FUNG|nr:histone chaperone [Entomophthora muscae]
MSAKIQDLSCKSASCEHEHVQEECIYDTLPLSVAKRIFGLKALQKQHHDLEVEFHKEMLALERKFAEKYQPLYTQRAAIVAGKSEPTADQIDIGMKLAEQESEEEIKVNPKPDVAPITGIPEFWLTCLKNNNAIADLITERDEEALLHLIDISATHLADDSGYTLTFTFSENEFFSNSQLSKTYYFKNSEPTGAIVVERSLCTEIKWKADKDLTMALKARKQRKKGSNETKIVKVLEPAQSFFCFFSSKALPTGEEDNIEELAAEYDDLLSMDFNLAEIFKDMIILHAVDWYTGLALDYEDNGDNGDEYDNMGYDCATSDEEEHSDESDDEIDIKAENKEVGPECKQQ